VDRADPPAWLLRDAGLVVLLAGRAETGMLAQVRWLTARAGDIGDALAAAVA
jgi:hypothetical protein